MQTTPAVEMTRHESHSGSVIAILSGRPLLPNTGIPLNLDWVREVRVNTSAVEQQTRQAASLREIRSPLMKATRTPRVKICCIGIEQQRFCRTNTIQICDHLTLGTHRDLKDALPGISVVQVVHVTGPESVEEAARVAPHVDAILLDSGNQKLAVKELGGTGRTHDWTLSRAIRERIGIPLFLAGGLTPENVGQAIEEVGPFGLDLCSGVRTDGKLDAAKLRRFFAAVRNAGAQ
ncbi:MAG TPA: phosphoribosylanthranilate isomerase [Terriglobales bacterium]